MMRRKTLIPEKIREEYLDYLNVREKYSREIFDFLERDLGEAGFSKVQF